jgi:predicted acetyltransferase
MTQGSATGSTDDPGDWQVVPLDRDADGAAVMALDRLAFAYPAPDSDFATEMLDSLPWGRLHGARAADGTLAGINAAHPFTLTVPGGTVRAGGVTWVGVHPDHRRRGLLRAMMGAHLDESAALGEPVSLLHAAEAAIYGRFGYGLAARRHRFTIARGAALRAVPGESGVRTSVVEADPDLHADLVGDLNIAAWAARPGAVPRQTPALRRLWLSDQPFMRDGAERRLLLLAHDARTGDPRGYALFRRKMQWNDGGPEGTVRVNDLAALDPAANAALWRRLLDLDLMARVETDARPLDDPLVHLLVDVRAALPRFNDGLWVRLVDVPAALAARRYPVEVDAVLDVRDDLRPANAGRWRLVGGPDGATCRRADGTTPDLALDVRELGAAYLGGESLAALAAAGLVTQERPGAAARVGSAFGWPVAPHCAWEF